jgi:hypothetical protein
MVMMYVERGQVWCRIDRPERAWIGCAEKQLHRRTKQEEKKKTERTGTFE